MIGKSNLGISVVRRCELLETAKSSCHRKKAEKQTQLCPMRLIDQVHQEPLYFGSRQMTSLPFPQSIFFIFYSKMFLSGINLPPKSHGDFRAWDCLFWECLWLGGGLPLCLFQTQHELEAVPLFNPPKISPSPTRACLCVLHGQGRSHPCASVTLLSRSHSSLSPFVLVFGEPQFLTITAKHKNTLTH